MKQSRCKVCRTSDRDDLSDPFILGEFCSSECADSANCWNCQTEIEDPRPGWHFCCLHCECEYEGKEGYPEDGDGR